MLGLAMVACVAAAVDVESIDQGSSGWVRHTATLAPNTHWVSMGDFGVYHRGLGARLASAGLLSTAAKLRTDRDHLVDQRQDFFLPRSTNMTHHYNCLAGEWCTVSLYFRHSGAYLSRYSKSPRETGEDYMDLARDDGGVIVSHHFGGPATRALWAGQLHWRASAIAKYLSVIGHIGGFSSEHIDLLVPLTLDNGDPDGVFGYADYEHRV